MNFDWNVWSTPLLVLGVGVLVGVAVLRNAPSDRARLAAEGRRRDLEREHETALERLLALETERDKMTPQDYEAAHKALLTRGAAALRALEGGAMASQGGSPPVPSGSPTDLGALVETLRRERERVGDVSFDAALRVATGRGAPATTEDDTIAPAWRGALYASAVWGLVALLVVFAGDQSTPRRDGGSMTGGTVAQGGPGGAPMQPPPNAPDFQAMAAPLEARLATDPNDLAALNELTQLWLSAGDAQQAMQYNQRAAEVAPEDPDVAASKAVLAAMVGLAPRALQILEDTLAKHPDHARSLTYKGLLLVEEGRHAEAVPVLERAVALQPGVPALQQALDAARRGETPGGAPPAPAPPPAPTGPGEVVLSGTIALGPGAKSSGAQLVFVSVRAPEGGPPLAAKRYPVGAFPLNFEITTADAISMGGAPRPFPEMMSLTVRLDGDGNAMTKEDLASGGAGGVARGTTGIALTLE